MIHPEEDPVRQLSEAERKELQLLNAQKQLRTFCQLNARFVTSWDDVTQALKQNDVGYAFSTAITETGTFLRRDVLTPRVTSNFNVVHASNGPAFMPSLEVQKGNKAAFSAVEGNRICIRVWDHIVPQDDPQTIYEFRKPGQRRQGGFELSVPVFLREVIPGSKNPEISYVDYRQADKIIYPTNVPQASSFQTRYVALMQEAIGLLVPGAYSEQTKKTDPVRITIKGRQRKK